MLVHCCWFIFVFYYVLCLCVYFVKLHGSFQLSFLKCIFFDLSWHTCFRDVQLWFEAVNATSRLTAEPANRLLQQAHRLIERRPGSRMWGGAFFFPFKDTDTRGSRCRRGPQGPWPTTDTSNSVLRPLDAKWQEQELLLNSCEFQIDTVFSCSLMNPETGESVSCVCRADC